MTSTHGAAPPDHLLDLAQWDALDESYRRAELVDGVVVMSPRPSSTHQRLVWRLAAALEAALGPSWRSTIDVELTLEASYPPTVRAPDVVVVAAADLDGRPRHPASEARAVFEVLSPGTRRVDRVAKLADYAAAGIAHYGIVEPGPPVTMQEFALRADGTYGLVADHAGRVRLAYEGVTLDLDALG